VVPTGFTREDEFALTTGLDLNAGDAGFFILEGTIALSESNFNTAKTLKPMAAVGWSASFFLDQVSLSLFAIFTESLENVIARAQLDWAITDHFSMAAHYTGIWMGSPDEYYQSLAEMDRATLVFRYHFNMGR